MKRNNTIQLFLELNLNCIKSYFKILMEITRNIFTFVVSRNANEILHRTINTNSILSSFGSPYLCFSYLNIISEQFHR